MPDQETGLYYLQSRYYNPTWGRFLNADSFVSTGQGILGNNMFAYCTNNPVIYEDAEGTRYRVVGAGVQFEVTMGCTSIGIEIICFWDVEECSNGGVVVAAFAYGGYSIDMNDPFLASILATVTDNTDLLLGGDESNILALTALIGNTFSVSASGVVVTGTETFNSWKSYTGSFTSVSGSIAKLKGSVAYSESCMAAAIGTTLIGAPDFYSWGVSKTYYEPIFSIAIGGAITQTSFSGGGCRIPCESRTRSTFQYAFSAY